MQYQLCNTMVTDCDCMNLEKQLHCTKVHNQDSCNSMILPLDLLVYAFMFLLQTIAVPSQAGVLPQAARHLRSPVLLQSTTDTFTFPQTPASPDQTLMEEDVTTPKVSYVSDEVSGKTKSKKDD